MAESSIVADSDVILPYRFEPDSLWSSSEDSDSDDTDSQASFTEKTGQHFLVLLREMSTYATCC